MDDNFSSLLLQKRKKEEEKAKEFKKASKDRLLKICQKKVETTMIGALASIEEELRKYWETNGEKPTNEQLLLKAAYDKIRKEILDKGNHQKRNMETEFEQYEIEWKRYTLNLPVVQGT